jgi:hypothetical protein
LPALVEVPQPESFESGFLHLKELDIALAVSSGVAYRCRLVTRAYQHQLRKLESDDTAPVFINSL